ncbi:DUF7266 family protein [Halobacteriaceae archaeon SHR40]|uniref:DUF7266 family protein n=1 Tax=Halovenus amylolytica TaxID=2500550 RepID=UPI000FE2A1EC
MKRNSHNLDDDTRAVSIAITHALTVAITTVLVSGLLISSGTLLESQEERVGDDQLSEIGSDVVSYINEFDRLNGTGTEVTATVTPNYPDRIVGTYVYNIELYDDGTVEVRSNRLGQSAAFEIDTDTNIEGGTVASGNIEINLCKNPQRITLGGCN